MDVSAGNDTMGGGAGNDVIDGIDGVVNNDSIDGGAGTADFCVSDPDPVVNWEV